MTATRLPTLPGLRTPRWHAVGLAALAVLVAAGATTLGLPGGPALPAAAAACAAVAVLLAMRRSSTEHQAAGLAVVILGAVGIVTQARIDGTTAASAQLGWAALAVAALVLAVAALRGTRRLPSAGVLQGAGLLLLLLPLVPALHRTANGATAWITVGGFSAQPVEVARPLLIAGAAVALHETGPYVRLGRMGVLLRVLAPTGVAVAVLVLAHNDLGPAMIISLTTAVLFILTRPPSRYLAALGAAVVVCAVAAYVGVPHLRDRIDDWIHPTTATGAVENTGIALRSLARGGIWGTGLGHGSPGQVANASSDFVLVAVAEERGLVGALCVVALLATVSLVLLRTPAYVTDDRRRVATAGLAVMFSVQAVYVVLASASVLPLTGIVVPFVSDGGSALVAMAAVVGAVLGAAAGPVPPSRRAADRLLAGLVSTRRVTAGCWAVAMVALVVVSQNPPVTPGRAPVAAAAVRGRLLSADGTVLAATVPGSGGGAERRYYDAVTAPLLNGTNGLDRSTAALQTCLPSRWDRLWNLPCPPRDVVLGLDTATQDTAAAALAGRVGAVVALDVRDFSVLAEYATGPDGGASAVAGTPGSVFKLVVAAAALENGVDTDTPQERTWTPPDGRGVVPNAGRASCGGSLEEALARSCNTSFARIAVALGADDLRATARAFGFERAVPARYREHPVSTVGPVRDIDEIARTGFGQQDVRASVLQMAVVGGVIGRGGTRPDVRYVLGRCDRGFAATPVDDGETVVSAGTARRIRAGMAASVDHGTATGLAGVDGGVLAKTGTAQTGEDPLTRAATSDAWVVALAPTDAPRVVVAVHLVGGGASPELGGGRDAGPPARAVLDRALAATSRDRSGGRCGSGG